MLHLEDYCSPRCCFIAIIKCFLCLLVIISNKAMIECFDSLGLPYKFCLGICLGTEWQMLCCSNLAALVQEKNETDSDLSCKLTFFHRVISLQHPIQKNPEFGLSHCQRYAMDYNFA